MNFSVHSNNFYRVYKTYLYPCKIQNLVQGSFFGLVKNWHLKIFELGGHRVEHRSGTDLKNELFWLFEIDHAKLVDFRNLNTFFAQLPL